MGYKMYILVMQNAQPLGYIKSISFLNGTYTITYNKRSAKSYNGRAAVEKDLRALAAMPTEMGISFIVG